MREWKKKGSSTETLCKLHYLSDVWVLGVLMHSLLLSSSLRPPPHKCYFIKLFPFTDVLCAEESVQGPCPSGFVVVQLLSHVLLFTTPWTAARQASLFFTMSLLKLMSILSSLLRLMSIELVMPPLHLILCCPLLLLPSIFPSIRVFSSESAPSSGSQNVRV